MKPARLVLVVVAIVVMAGCTTSRSSFAPAQAVMDDIFRQELDQAFTPGREVIVSIVELPPDTTLQRHWHPGEEFHYYLEGDARIEIDGEERIIGTPGTVGHVPYRLLHTAKTGPQGARVLVFRVHETGKPVRFLEDEHRQSHE